MEKKPFENLILRIINQLVLTKSTESKYESYMRRYVAKKTKILFNENIFDDGLIFAREEYQKDRKLEMHQLETEISVKRMRLSKLKDEENCETQELKEELLSMDEDMFSGFMEKAAVVVAAVVVAAVVVDEVAQDQEKDEVKIDE